MEIKYFGVRENFYSGPFDTRHLGKFPLTRECLRIRKTGERVENPDKLPVCHAISGINGSDKWTENSDRCLLVVISGQTALSEPLSMVAHVAPGAITQASNPFLEEYPDLLSDFARQAQIQRHAFIAGGDGELTRFTNCRLYQEMINQLTLTHKRTLGISTRALPRKETKGKTHLYFKNGERVYVVETNAMEAHVKPTPLPAGLKTI